MDAFFKLANSSRPPSCPEANEYLAEDRVMCLQIYIKEDCGYFLTYIPDAIAVTDAPADIITLIKQRRRWMNGALFAAWRVLFNNLRMTGLAGRSQHPCYR
jgi:chitin synthase